jgi:molybdopterin molybdotransferase
MTRTKRPASSLTAESISTPNMAIGASELVDIAQSARERRCEPRQFLAPARALQIILDGVEALPGEENVAICDTAGRVTLEDIRSPVSLPRFDNSAMDGYGLHIDDLQTDGSTRLPIVDRIQAGGSMAIPFSRGSAVRVTTGAQVPQGVAAVVPDEHVDVQGSMLKVRRVPREGANIRPRGEDVGRGELLAPAGTLIDARYKALMAAAGVREVLVRRHITVGLLSTGDELVDPGEPVPAGKIVDVNSMLLRPLLAACGAVVLDFGIAPDCLEKISRAISDAASLDVLISTGGAANSETDLTSKAVAMIGGSVTSLPLALKPGRSIAYGRLGQTRILHLPGNPLAALVSSLLFAVPLLNRLAGRAPEVPALPVRAGAPIHHQWGRTEWFLATVIEHSPGEEPIIVKSGHWGSACLKQLAEADGLAEIDSNVGDIAVGDRLRFRPFDASRSARNSIHV